LLHEITELVPLEQITEVQIKGLFARWTHEHRFEQQGSDQVIVRDRIDFDPPAGMLGLLVTAGKILDQLDEGYHHRNLQLQKELGGST
jgi:ligand-binding SRPBCC domain-containing protein